MTYRYIYKITCTTGSFKGKFYFGQHTTNKLNDDYKGSGKKLSDYYKKYPNDYVKEIISFHDTQDDLNDAEYKIIKPWLNHPMCLNLCDGGGAFNWWNYLSDEEKEKYKSKLKGRTTWNKGIPQTEETKLKLSKSHLGKTHTEESKRKMSEQRKVEGNSMFGKKHSDDTKRKISQAVSKAISGENNPFYGKQHSYKTKKRISEANIGEKNGMYGKHLSEAAKQKISEANKARWAERKAKRDVTK